MRILLDTHVALWAIAKTTRVPPEIAELIGDPANAVVVSAVSVWEIAIRHALSRGGPDDMAVSGARVRSYFHDAGYQFLSVSAEQAAAVESLPRRHGDPFDRLLAAQALSEPLRLLTHDKTVAAYSDTVIRF